MTKHRINLEQQLEKKRQELLNKQGYPKINPMPLTSNNYSPEEYINMCNSSGLVLATCADYYNSAKNNVGLSIELIPEEAKKSSELIKKIYNERGNKSIPNWIMQSKIKTRVDKQIDIIQKILYGGAGKILTGDSIEYSHDCFNAKIIRNNKSTTKTPVENEIIIPAYSNIEMNQVFNTVIGLKFLQNLFNTNDMPEMLYANLKKVFGIDLAGIYINTPKERFPHFSVPIFFLGIYSHDKNNYSLCIDCAKDYKETRAYCLESSSKLSRE
jgi:hypothetical protein